MTTTERTSGAQELSITLGLASLAWLVMGIQEILLFARPVPYGGPYVIHPILYFPYALFYNLLGVMIVVAPVAVV